MTHPQQSPPLNAHGLQAIAEARNWRMGFLTEAHIEAIASDPGTRLQPIIVRCGSGRFMAPAQDVAHFAAIIRREGSDYIRDMSLPPQGGAK